MSISVIGIGWVLFIEAWPYGNEMVDQDCVWSAPGLKVSGGTDRSLLGVDEFQDNSVQHRVG